MAKPKPRAAKRSPKPARSAAKPAKAKSPKKTATKAARKAPVTATRKLARPAAGKAATASTMKSRAARPAAGAATKKAAKASHNGKPATAAAAKAVHGARHHDKPGQVAVQAAPARHAGHGTPHATTSRRVHVRPSGGVAARLSVAAGGDEQTITREDGRYALPATVNIELPKGYQPSNKEEYMGPRQLAYFRQKLKTWRDQLVEESRQTMENLRDEVRDVGDDAERATRETENSLELRTRDRYRKLISKIEKALRKIEEGRYGYCEETDEEIGLERLEARPIATLSLDAQERREHMQKQMGD